jgi:2,3-bisphosphoglycerate-dependent phosphoglycerate mutase
MIILKVMHQTKIPIVANKALNERLYGSLQGQNKAEAINIGQNKLPFGKEAMILGHQMKKV